MRIMSPSQRRPHSILKSTRTDADAEEQAGEEVVDADGERHDVVDLLGRGPAEGGDVLFRDHRVVQRIVLVVELDDRARQLGAFLEPRRVESEPAATLRTTTSSGMISTSRISCSRMFSRRMKCVGTPISLSFHQDVLADAVVEHTLAVDNLVPFFLALKAVASSLKCWISVPGSGPS
jgi:hypothetical protein